MARVCEITGIKPLTGNRVSHANNKTKHRQLPNLKAKKYYIPEAKRNITLTLSTSAIRSIEKMGGISATLIKTDASQLSERLQKIKKQIQA
ncbi:MAG TPA: 50S ribosomal protein L28 [Oligoflexia bacterium]|nr:50S ribosomal protein L28 [Oligoflexia bacterium]HMR24046.1 50S ribosomal protein L28 [Oligoflexia bacterium]